MPAEKSRTVERSLVLVQPGVSVRFSWRASYRKPDCQSLPHLPYGFQSGSALLMSSPLQGGGLWPQRHKTQPQQKGCLPVPIFVGKETPPETLQLGQAERTSVEWR